MKYAPIVVFFLLLSSVGLAEEITLDIAGECRYYNVTVTARNFSEACYDVKVEALSEIGRGFIYDERGGWKSSFYYIDEALCTSETSTKTFSLRIDATDTVSFMAKLRLDNDIWESQYYSVDQDCPPQPGQEFVFAISLIVILILTGTIAWYVKKK